MSLGVPESPFLGGDIRIRFLRQKVLVSVHFQFLFCNPFSNQKKMKQQLRGVSKIVKNKRFTPPDSNQRLMAARRIISI